METFKQPSMFTSIIQLPVGAGEGAGLSSSDVGAGLGFEMF
jgi:hypothetical protein